MKCFPNSIFRFLPFLLFKEKNISIYLPEGHLKFIWGNPLICSSAEFSDLIFCSAPFENRKRKLNFPGQLFHSGRLFGLSSVAHYYPLGRCSFLLRTSRFPNPFSQTIVSYFNAGNNSLSTVTKSWKTLRGCFFL